MYGTIIRLASMFRCEICTRAKPSEDTVKDERRVLRCIHGAIWKRSYWRIRYNVELYEIFEDPAVSVLVKFPNSALTMCRDARIPKQALNCEVRSTQSQGKPQKRYDYSSGRTFFEAIYFGNQESFCAVAPLIVIINGYYQTVRRFRRKFAFTKNRNIHSLM